MISIVTGTLNRRHLLSILIKNTVDSDQRLELVLVDGGSTDGTIEYIKNLNHPRIKFIEVGKRSSYPHFMNLGIKNASHEYICQWNDDAYMINSWQEVIDNLEEQYDFYLFNWKYGSIDNTVDPNWLAGLDYHSGWCLADVSHSGGEIVVNYGIYSKKIFRQIGMYNMEYFYYYADGDMSYRANKFGFKHKNLRDVKVCSLYTPKTALQSNYDKQIYEKNLNLYNKKILPNTIELLK
jgi:glycosyltransferase involved in cell wall biosynthesis